MVLTKRKTLIIAIVVLSSLLAFLLCLLLIPKKEPENRMPETTPVTTQETVPPNPVEFAYENGFLTCLSAESILGIDVSSHQKGIDWQKVKEAGIAFAMIRVGYRGLDQGGLYLDEFAQSNYQGAKKAGLQVGAYFFSQATTPEEAAEEAEYALSITESWDLDLPLVFDWEYSGEENRVAAMTAPQVTQCAEIFCSAVEKAGKEAMVYFNPHVARDYLYLDTLQNYPFWLALYDDTLTYDRKIDMWQYTCEGTVPGIEGNVDINLYFP